MLERDVARRDLRARLAGADFLVGTWITLTDPAAVEIARGSDLDFIVIDAEHSALGPESVDRLVGASLGSELDVVVRVPWTTPSLAAQALDAGADGVLLPQIRTAAEAASGVSVARYPPEGSRGWGPRRPTRYGRGSQDYRETANARVAVIVQIELREAVANLEDILRVPGLDAVLIGPNDLSGSYGQLGHLDAPEVVAAIDHTLRTCAVEGVPVGIACGGTNAEIDRWRARGCRFVAASADYILLANAFDALAATRPGPTAPAGFRRGG